MFAVQLQKQMQENVELYVWILRLIRSQIHYVPCKSFYFNCMGLHLHVPTLLGNGNAAHKFASPYPSSGRLWDRKTNCSTCWELSEERRSETTKPHFEKRRSLSTDVAGIARIDLATSATQGNLDRLVAHHCKGLQSSATLGSSINASSSCSNFSRSVDLVDERAFWAFLASSQLHDVCGLGSLSSSQLIDSVILLSGAPVTYKYKRETGYLSGNQTTTFTTSQLQQVGLNETEL